jgi:hypothetical protein
MVDRSSSPPTSLELLLHEIEATPREYWADLLDALRQFRSFRSGFYTKLGFDFADPHESLPPEMPYRTMYFDLKPVLELLNPQPSEAESG